MKLTLRGEKVTGESRLIVPQCKEKPGSGLPLSPAVIVQFSTSYDYLKFIIVFSLPSTSIFSSITQSISPLLDIHNGTTLTSASTSYNWSRHFRVYNYNLVPRSHFSNAFHLPLPQRSQNPCHLPRQSRPRILLTGIQVLP
jgi:hypothetical protein